MRLTVNSNLDLFFFLEVEIILQFGLAQTIFTWISGRKCDVGVTRVLFIKLTRALMS